MQRRRLAPTNAHAAGYEDHGRCSALEQGRCRFFPPCRSSLEELSEVRSGRCRGGAGGNADKAGYCLLLPDGLGLASKIRRYARGTSVESSVSEEPTQIWWIWAGCSARPSSVYGRFDDLYNLVPDRFLLVVWDRVRKHARSARTAIVGASDGYAQTQDPRGLRKIPPGHPRRTGYNHHPEMSTEERYASKGARTVREGRRKGTRTTGTPPAAHFTRRAPHTAPYQDMEVQGATGQLGKARLDEGVIWFPRFHALIGEFADPDDPDGALRSSRQPPPTLRFRHRRRQVISWPSC